MNEDRPDNSIFKTFKTRRSEVISGISVACLIGLYGFARSVVSDITTLVENASRATDQRIERVERAIKEIMDIERASRREEVGELKQRIVWLEREINARQKTIK